MGKFSVHVFSVVVLGLWCQLALSQSIFPVPGPFCKRQPERCVDASKVCCKNPKYRTMDGSCNNPLNPTMGMAFTSYRRLLPARYADQISSIPVAKSGRPLPSARLLSTQVFGRSSIPDPNFTMMNMLWGQAVIHDTSNRISSRSPQLIRPLEVKRQTCCSTQRRFEIQTTNVPCAPITVPTNDQFFRGAQCLTFDRTITDKDQKCAGSEGRTPAEQLTGVTHYLDLSFVYGNSDEQSKSLRAMFGGLMLTSDHEQMWPPKNFSSQPNQGPIDPYAPQDTRSFTYIFGDSRGNQNPGLTSLHIVFLREHNRIARELAQLNPNWNDETLFQEARRINIAQYQHIIYYEWNVNFYGYMRSLRMNLIHNVHLQKYVNDYSVCVDPRSTQAFQHSSFRFFHNQIMGTFHVATESRSVYNSTIRLTSVLGRSSIVEEGCPFNPRERGCKYSSFIRGLSNQNAASFDTNFDPEVAENFPIELRSFDLQRDRDHGIASYNEFRVMCGLRRAYRWEDYGDHIPATDINKLRSLYESYEDVDLSVGAALERADIGSVVGPTFTCINIKQFWSLRAGDRYFFENGMQPYPFTPAQLAEIRKSSASRLLCDNGNIQSMQPNAFKKISSVNSLRPCSFLPKVDLTLWKKSVANGVCPNHGASGFPGRHQHHFGGSGHSGGCHRPFGPRRPFGSRRPFGVRRPFGRFDERRSGALG